MGRLKIILIFSLTLTLPVNIFGIYWLKKTFKTYHELDKFEVTMDKTSRFFRVGNAEFDDAIRRIKSVFNLSEKADVQLLINQKDLHALFSDLPKSGFDDKDDTYLIMDNVVLKGKPGLEAIIFITGVLLINHGDLKPRKKVFTTVSINLILLYQNHWIYYQTICPML